MKECTKCGATKTLKEFYNNKNTKDGKTYNCKSCSNIRKEKRSRSRDGLVVVLYCSQRANSKHRNDPMPNYTIQEFTGWLFSQPNFETIYNAWVDSGYNRNLRPSPDRDNKKGDYDYLPYDLNRLRLVTFGDNLRKSHKDRRSGINNKHNKKVKQLTRGGNTIKEYHSTQQASRETMVAQSSISRVCAGKLGSAGGYIWEFV